MGEPVEVEVIDQDSMPTETQSSEPQDSTLMETQSHTSREKDKKDQEVANTRVKIEKTVLVKPEEKERKEEKRKTTERRDKKKSPSKLSRRSRPSQLPQRNQRLSTRLSENPLVISKPLTLPTKRKRRKPEILKESKVLKPLRVMSILARKPAFFSKKLMLPEILVPVSELDSWDSVESKMTKMLKFSPEIPEVEEEEEVEEVEEEETGVEPEVETLKVVPEDKIQSKPSRKLKKISHPYEREDRFDLPSKELADSTTVINRLLIVLKRFF